MLSPKNLVFWFYFLLKLGFSYMSLDSVHLSRATGDLAMDRQTLSWSLSCVWYQLMSWGPLALTRFHRPPRVGDSPVWVTGLAQVCPGVARPRTSQHRPGCGLCSGAGSGPSGTSPHFATPGCHGSQKPPEHSCLRTGGRETRRCKGLFLIDTALWEGSGRLGRSAKSSTTRWKLERPPAGCL